MNKQQPKASPRTEARVIARVTPDPALAKVTKPAFIIHPHAHGHVKDVRMLQAFLDLATVRRTHRMVKWVLIWKEAVRVGEIREATREQNRKLDKLAAELSRFPTGWLRRVSIVAKSR
jgi:hypothetical protein